MRSYVNDTIYNSLLVWLRNMIINTTVAPGHYRLDSENYVTTDKLYLFSTREIWEKNRTM